MNTIGWQEIAIRLLFAFILGGATAISRRWYKTKQFIQTNTQMALGAAMFSLLASLSSTTKFSSQVVLGISIICVGISWQKQYPQINIDTITRLWCAGAVGSMVGFGFFVPAYIGILIIILTNMLFAVPENNFIPYMEKELERSLQPSESTQSQPKIAKEIYYRCQVKCLAKDESEVLALLVQLAKEQNLTLTGIRSKNLVNDTASEIETQLDFVSDSNDNLLQLQQVSMNLKSKLEVGSVSWLDLSPELSNKKLSSSKLNLIRINILLLWSVS